MSAHWYSGSCRAGSIEWESPSFLPKKPLLRQPLPARLALTFSLGADRTGHLCFHLPRVRETGRQFLNESTTEKQRIFH